MIYGTATAPVTPRKALLLKIGIFVSFILLSFGCITLSLLMDMEETSALSKSDFGGQVRRLLQWNPMLAAIFLNGGLVGMIYFFSQLFPCKDLSTKDEESKKVK